MAKDITNNACRVFVVDDEILIATTLAAILRDHGFDCTYFTDPRKVLEMIGPRPPHVLVSDVMMPGLTGIDLAFEVWKVCPDCRVFLMSALDSVEHMLPQRPPRGAKFQFFNKPFHPEQLLNALESQISFGS
jgi:DNA-binding NtrC family response regulator